MHVLEKLNVNSLKNWQQAGRGVISKQHTTIFEDIHQMSCTTPKGPLFNRRLCLLVKKLFSSPLLWSSMNVIFTCYQTEQCLFYPQPRPFQIHLRENKRRRPLLSSQKIYILLGVHQEVSPVCINFLCGHPKSDSRCWEPELLHLLSFSLPQKNTKTKSEAVQVNVFVAL